MRWLVLLMLVAIADADPRPTGARDRKPDDVTDAIAHRDAGRLAAMVFATSTADRVRVLDALIDLGTLDKRYRDRVPTKDAVAMELAKLATEPRAAKLFTPQSCSLGSVSATEVVLRCEPRGCDSGCMVVRGEATVRLKSGRLSIGVLVVKNVGDTGECGCCM